MRSFISFLKDESGAAAAEYALILAVVAGGIAVAAGTLGTDITNTLNAIAKDVTLAG
jgi:pilus assembly protein Flp/PilA